MSTPRLRDTWLLRRHEAAVLGAMYVVISALWVGIGWLLVHPLKDSGIVRTDESIAKWFADRRTSGWNSLTYIGSMLSDTLVKILVTAVVAIAMLLVWKRWLEPLIVCMASILEAMCFITITWIVGRPRPDVPRLEDSPVGSSFPSGHVGAAVAYSAIAVVLFWHTRRTWIRALAVVLAVVVPGCVGLSRMYRGMHFFTDVIFGALLGVVSVVATVIVLRRADERYEVVAPSDEPRIVGLEPVAAAEQ